jgi:glycosyltransferase involved in cell wall biosynthesis
MSQLESDKQLRVLLVAVACSPVRGSEGGMGWNRALQSARFFKTHVVSDQLTSSLEVKEYLAKNGPIENLTFEFVEDGFWGRMLRKSKLTFYFSYRLWHHRAYEVCKRLQNQHQFDLVHHATYCGFREPGLTWKLPVPFVWGPVGGTQNLPWRFLWSLGLNGIVIEGIRNISNLIQLRYGLATRRALKHCSAFFAANTGIQADCEKYFGVSPEVRLETGINQIATHSKPELDTSRPFRIIWTGEFRPRKALHLLLEAIPQIPADLKVEVRVLGEGPEQKRWQKLAEKLGVNDRVTFLGRLPRQAAIEQLSWADVFVFTSLRDTTGTVLPEALSQGVPVIGLDHQGFLDLVSEQCGVKIPVTTPKEVAARLAKEIHLLALDPERYRALHIGALERAKNCTWDSHGEHMAQVYRRVVAKAKSSSST